MTLETGLQAAQLIVSLITLGGAGFVAGRFSARFEVVEKALFGGDRQEGIFVRRTEVELRDEEVNRRLEYIEQNLVRRG